MILNLFRISPSNTSTATVTPCYSLRCYLNYVLSFDSPIHIAIFKSKHRSCNSICIYSLSPITIPPSPLPVVIPHPPNPAYTTPSLKRPPPNPSASIPPGLVPRKGLSPTRRILQQPALPPVGAVTGFASFSEPYHQHCSCKPGCAARPGYRYWCDG